MSISSIQPTSNNCYYLIPKIDVKKAVRITCIALLFISALGLIFIGFQPIFFVSSFNRQNSDSHQLSPQQLQTSDLVTESPESSPDSAVSRDISPHLSCLQRVESAKERLLQCPAAKDLWDQLEREGGISLECVDDIPRAAACSFIDRTIKISEVIDDRETVPLLLFEMNNLKRAPKFIRLARKACDLSAQKYSIDIERLEFHSAKDTRRIAAQCVQTGIWPAEWDEFSIDLSDNGKFRLITHDELMRLKIGQPLTFAEHLAVQELGGHTRIYRDEWHRRCDFEKERQWLLKVMSAAREAIRKSNTTIDPRTVDDSELFWKKLEEAGSLIPRDWLN